MSLVNLPLCSCGNLLNDEVLDVRESDEAKEYFETNFEKNISSDSNLLLQTRYNEYVISSSIINDNNIENVWLSSIDKDGKPLFESIIKSDKNTRVAAQITDPDNNSILVCNEFDPSNNSTIIIINISQNKTVTWYKKLGSSTSTKAISAVLRSDGILAIIAASKNTDTSLIEPVLILYNTLTKSLTSIKLQFIIPYYSNRVYPIPAKIACNSDDSLIIASYFNDPVSGKNRITVVKLDSSSAIISGYMLSEFSKNIDVLDIISQNKNNDIFLLCKSDTPFSRTDGFTLLKIFSNNKKVQKKFENDYLINGFRISENFITDSNGDFAIGGDTYNGVNNNSAIFLKFNNAGNMKKYFILESGIDNINKLVFSQFEKNTSLSYIYSCNKLSAHIDGRLRVRKKNINGDSTAKTGVIYKDIPDYSGTLHPVDIDEYLSVETENAPDITIEPEQSINIEWR